MSICLKSKKKISWFISFQTAFPGDLDSSGSPVVSEEDIGTSVTLVASPPPALISTSSLAVLMLIELNIWFSYKISLGKKQILLARQILKINDVLYTPKTFV